MIKPSINFDMEAAIDMADLINLQLAVKVAKKHGGVCGLKLKYSNRPNDTAWCDLKAAIEILDKYGYKDQLVITHSTTRGWYFNQIESDSLKNVICSIAAVLDLQYTPFDDVSQTISNFLHQNPSVDILLTVEK